MVQENRFREDLFYRINVLTVQIPPLRERLMDIPFLAGSFLQQFNRKLGKIGANYQQGCHGQIV